MEAKYQFTANEGKKITAKNGATITVEYRSKVIEPGREYTVNGSDPFVINYASYPSITELCHQSDEKNNGKLIATVTATAVEGDSSTSACVMMSADRGKTWQTIDDPLKGTKTKDSKDRVGYSAGLWVGADKKTLYYVNSMNSKDMPDSTKEIGFVKFSLYDALS